MTYRIRQLARIVTLFAIFSILTGCGGTHVLKEPRPLPMEQALATGNDANIEVDLNWVIVRDGPGTWARNADWDEYLLRVRNRSGQSLSIEKVSVIDSMQTRVEQQPGRKQLVKGSKTTARRYRDSGLKVKAGSSAGTMLVAGTTVTAVGLTTASMVATGGWATGASTAGSAGAVASGLIWLGPALAVGGILRGANNNAVNAEIEKRQTILPLDVPPDHEASLDLFFPLAPSPVMVELVYADDSGRQHTITIDTSAVLEGLHFDDSSQQT